MHIARLVVVTVLLGALGVFAVGSCSGGGSSAFCETFCPAYVSCAGESKSSTKVPLFCDDALAGTCQPLCEQTTDSLGDSKSAFLDCAKCTLDYDSKDACDKDKLKDTGKVSCIDSCSKPGAEDATDKLFNDFTEAFTPKIKDATCTGTGEKSWAANDPAVSHGGGEDGGNGKWKCTGYCGYVMYGLYLWLPAGSYTAGFTDVTTTGTPPETDATLDVTDDGGSTTLVKRTLKPSQLGGTSGRISVNFTLSSWTENVEVRLSYDGGITIGGVFISRE